MQLNHSYLGLSSIPPQTQTKSVRNVKEEESKANQTEGSSEVNEVDDMDVFTKELLKEISAIYKNASDKSNNSLQISDEALVKMKNDPEFKKEMLVAIKEDLTKASENPYKSFNSISINESGFSSIKVSEYLSDTDKEKEMKKTSFDLTTKDAFFVKYEAKDTDFDQVLDQNKYEKDMWEQKNIYNREKKASSVGSIKGRHYQPNTHDIRSAIENNLKGKTSI